MLTFGTKNQLKEFADFLKDGLFMVTLTRWIVRF